MHPHAYRHSANGHSLQDGSCIPFYPRCDVNVLRVVRGKAVRPFFLDGPVFVELLGSTAPESLLRLLAAPIRHERSGRVRTAPVISP